VDSHIKAAVLTLEPEQPNCPLCTAGRGTPLFEDGVNVNKILAGGNGFFVVPALGPLVLGHVLVISASHTEGLLYLSPDTRQRYATLSRVIRAYCAHRGTTVLEAEHGARHNSVRGPCIRHTHIHVLPGLGDLTHIFDERKDLDAVSTSDISSLGDTYLWIGNGIAQRLYRARNAAGQEIRRTVGGHLGVESWDWAVTPNTRLISSTIEYWSELDGV
jgi:diadenosine tetraphosphate (Ap4A) HIT family hydrolase